MKLTETISRRMCAASEFDEHEGSDRGEQVAISLSDGLTTVRNLIFTRVHDDVEQYIGVDSMLLSAAYLQSEKKTKIEVELYQIAESAAEAKRRGYVSDYQWYARWLGELRLGDPYPDSRYENRVTRYLSMLPDERRLAFARVLERTFKEATRAPLILYQLFPYAIGIVTCTAFGETLDAGELRNRQKFWLPGIADCHECHGRTLDNGDTCPMCGNPVWSFHWLTATD